MALRADCHRATQLVISAVKAKMEIVNDSDEARRLVSRIALIILLNDQLPLNFLSELTNDQEQPLAMGERWMEI